jgi:ATP diphosphatase
MSLCDEVKDLLNIMAIMRDPHKGCSWTREQTYKSLLRHTIEEAYEVADVVEREEHSELKGELADLLNQVIFYSRLAEEDGNFDFKDVVCHLKTKLIKRHPDVFSTYEDKTVDELEDQWERLKHIERTQNSDKSILSHIAYNMPALSIANKIQTRVSAVGFDWDGINEVVLKIQEESLELVEAFSTKNKESIIDELGDLMFSCVNLARHLREDSEQVMRLSCRKFEQRFRKVESVLESQNIDLKSATKEEYNQAWNKAKKLVC